MHENRREITEDSSQGNEDSFFSTLRDPKRKKSTAQMTATTFKNVTGLDSPRNPRFNSYRDSLNQGQSVKQQDFNEFWLHLEEDKTFSHASRATIGLHKSSDRQK